MLFIFRLFRNCERVQYVRQILELAIEIRIISLRAFFELDKCCKIKMAKGTILSGNITT